MPVMMVVIVVELVQGFRLQIKIKTESKTTFSIGFVGGINDYQRG
jgi:hypothetical protein